MAILLKVIESCRNAVVFCAISNGGERDGHRLPATASRNISLPCCEPVSNPSQ
jgi:hypothetical protein